MTLINRPRSIYIAPRLSGQNCEFLKFILSLNSQKRIQNLNTKKTIANIEACREGPRSLARILIYQKRPPAGRRRGGGVLPYLGYIGMCGPKGYHFSAVFVINRVSI